MQGKLTTLSSTSKTEMLNQLFNLAAVAEDAANKKRREARPAQSTFSSNLGKHVLAVHNNNGRDKKPCPHGMPASKYMNQTLLQGLDLPSLSKNDLRALGVCLNCLQRGHFRAECRSLTIECKLKPKKVQGH